ncbi:MAG: ACT domain-containing protein [Alphaproteobacteria bacterium]
MALRQQPPAHRRDRRRRHRGGVRRAHALRPNQDKPGFIGQLGRVLGDAGINIAAFNNGRSQPGADALCLVSTDEKVDEGTMARIRALPQVLRVRALRF